MKAEYINPFFKATQEVFNSMLDIKPQKKELDKVEDLVAVQEANVIIGMTGDLSGSVLYSFPRDMTLEMIRIMSGMKMDQLDSFVTSALSELANIISGNAVTYLTEENIRADIVPPQIMVGANNALSMATENALLLTLDTEIGEFQVTFSIKEKKG